MRSLLLVLSSTLLLAPALAADSPVQRSRVVFLADMGNEPDEEQQMVHMLACSNEFEIQGLIAVTGKYLRKVPKPELFLRLIDGYEKDLPSLKQHASGWQEAAALRKITVAGQGLYGIADTGAGKASPGSKLIAEALKRADPRPLYVVINAGSNTLAQALVDLRSTSTKAAMDGYVRKLRVFENGAQDNAGAWICARFPQIHWFRSNFQTYAYGGPSRDGAKDQVGGKDLGPYTWQPFPYSFDGQHAWAKKHIQTGHGALGGLYPDRRFKPGGDVSFLEGGGTAPWLALLWPGVADIDHPEWGGPSGRSTSFRVKGFWSRHDDIRKDEEAGGPFSVFADASDTWTDPGSGREYSNTNAPVWRWREAGFNDFAARMDWAVLPFAKANHAPIADIAGDAKKSIRRITAKAGATLDFDASGSRDPDGDKLAFRWWVYGEAGSYAGPILVSAAETPTARLHVPSGAEGKEVHLILEVRDTGRERSLFDFRRIVVSVAQP